MSYSGLYPMGGYPPNMTPHYAGYSTQISTQPAPVPTSLHRNNCSLDICQQPREALLTVRGKEKFRKPVDPPPILQLKVLPDADPQSQYLQNPYLFVAVTLYKADRDEPFENTPSNTLAGVLVSSLHRLKSIENKDGGFFVFGDISVKEGGLFRLRFTLFEFKPDRQEYIHVTNVTSNKFAVVLPKDFRGLEESSYLSRSFSDQGVRLRIRKETRGMASKRSYTDESPSNQNALLAPDVEYQPPKKRREEYIDSPVTPSSAPHINMPSYMPSSMPSSIPRQPLPHSTVSYGRLPMGQPLGSSSMPMPQEDLRGYYLQTQSEAQQAAHRQHQQLPQQPLRHQQHIPPPQYTAWQGPSTYNEDAGWDYTDTKPH